jgi:HPt (histidine-containing phosphotransfer) domain-containing protein
MVFTAIVQQNRGVQLIDPAVVLDRHQLREITLDDDELMREVLSALLDDTSKQVTLLDLAIRDKDPQKTMRLAHYSKGACANVGANRAAAVLKKMEQQALQQSFGECQTSLTNLMEELERLKVEAAQV